MLWSAGAGLLLVNRFYALSFVLIAVAPRSPQVCACFDVSEARIREHLAAGAGEPDDRLQALQQALRCGTQCGSCLPALRRLAAEVPQPA